MISKQTIFIAGLATIVLLSIFWGYIKPTGPTLKDVVREERASFDSHVSPTPQHPDVRRWVLRDFHKIVTIPSPEVLKAPERTRVASDGTIFVLDIKDHSVKVFSPSGTAITTVPDPNRRSIDFALSQDGTMWFADANSSLIGVTSEGKKMPGSSSPLRAMRVEAVGNNLLLMLRPDSDEMFASYSDAGNTILRFGHMLEHQKTTGAAVTGEIAADEESNALFHAATYAGILDSYDPSGTLQFVVQTIAPLRLPSIEVTKDGSRIPFTAPYSCLALCVYGDNIFLLTEMQARGKLQKSVIDVYRKQDGSYLYSIEAPERSWHISLSRDMLYSISDNGLTVFKVNPPL